MMKTHHYILTALLLLLLPSYKMTEATEAGKTIARMKRKEDCLSAVSVLHYLW